MGVISLVVLILAALALGLIILNIPVSQRAINIILLILVIFLAIGGSNWGNNLFK